MLQQQKQKPKHRNNDVHVKDTAGIAGSEVVLVDHLVDVPHGCAEGKQPRTENRSKAKVEAPKGGDEANHGKTEAGRSHFELKRAPQPMNLADIAPKKPCITKL